MQNEKWNIIVPFPAKKKSLSLLFLLIFNNNTLGIGQQYHSLFLFPSILATIGCSKWTWRRYLVSCTAGCVFKKS